MKMKVKLDTGAHLPEPSTTLKNGYDIRCREGFVLYANKPKLIRTGIHIQTESELVDMVQLDSGRMVRDNILAVRCLDETTTDELVIKFYNLGNSDKLSMAGDIIARMYMVHVATPEIELVEE